jgi:hypothetical protein
LRIPPTDAQHPGMERKQMTSIRSRRYFRLPNLPNGIFSIS